MNDGSEIQQKDRSRLWLFFFGDRSWSFYAAWILGVIVAAGALVMVELPAEMTARLTLNWVDVLQLGLLLIIVGYLADIRYRLFEEIRAD